MSFVILWKSTVFFIFYIGAELSLREFENGDVRRNNTVDEDQALPRARSSISAPIFSPLRQGANLRFLSDEVFLGLRVGRFRRRRASPIRSFSDRESPRRRSQNRAV